MRVGASIRWSMPIRRKSALVEFLRFRLARLSALKLDTLSEHKRKLVVEDIERVKRGLSGLEKPESSDQTDPT